ncbi:hypothetical protein V8C86DRAFT_1406117 [Haematococcus lacustris]
MISSRCELCLAASHACSSRPNLPATRHHAALSCHPSSCTSFYSHHHASYSTFHQTAILTGYSAVPGPVTALFTLRARSRPAATMPCTPSATPCQAGLTYLRVWQYGRLASPAARSRDCDHDLLGGPTSMSSSICQEVDWECCPELSIRLRQLRQWRGRSGSGFTTMLAERMVWLLSCGQLRKEGRNPPLASPFFTDIDCA